MPVKYWKFPSFMKNLLLIKLRKKFLSKIELNRAFSKRIRQRRQRFWREGLENIYILEDPIDISKLIQVPLWQRFMSDKYNSRRFVEQLGIKTPKLYWVGKDVDDIPWETLPKNFVVKPSRDWNSNGIFVVKNNINLLNGKTISLSDIKKA